MTREFPLRTKRPVYEYGELSQLKGKGKMHDRDLNVVEEGLRRKATACFQSLIPELFREFRQALQPTARDTDSMDDTILTAETIFGGFNFAQMDFHLPSEMNLFMNPFSMLGDAEMGFDHGGLLENLLQPVTLGADGQKRSDSGYESNSLELRRREMNRTED
jgi:hypothetical protein